MRTLRAVVATGVAGACDARLAFLFLDGDRAVIEGRLRARRGHDVPAALLDAARAADGAPRASEDDR